MLKCSNVEMLCLGEVFECEAIETRSPSRTEFVSSRTLALDTPSLDALATRAALGYNSKAVA